MRIGIETTGTIYGRLATVIATAIEDYGHECVRFDRKTLSDKNPLHLVLERLDWVLVTTHNSILNYALDDGSYLFEHAPSKLAFLHHDAIISENFELGEIALHLAAWARVAERSLHFTIEDRDARLLRQLGIQCVLVNHMASIPRFIGKLNDSKMCWSASFVGHVLPPTTEPEKFGAHDELLFDLTRSRLDDFSLCLEPAIVKLFPIASFSDVLAVLRGFSERIQVLNLLRLYTVRFRGAAFERTGALPLDIIGGDPNLTRIPKRQLARANTRYHDAVFDPDAVGLIYRQFAVSLNLTSLQFDTAVINRVIDVFVSGGFCLTDFRAGLPLLTSLWSEISFANADEMTEKTCFYTDPRNQGRRKDLIAQVRTDFEQTCSSHLVVGKIVRAMVEHK